MIRKVNHILLSLSLVLAAAGVGYSQLEEISDTSDTNRNYKIGIGDVLNVVVTKQDLLSLNAVRVSNEGSIRMPMIKEQIDAACLSEAELSAVIAEKYRKLILEPEVFVTVTEFNSNPVSLIGAVITPSRFDVRRPARLLEMLALVNGPAANAGERVQIVRQSTGSYCQDSKLVKGSFEGDQELISVALSETLKGSSEANPYVRAGDIITVPIADAPEEAYVIGNVGRAQAIALDQPISLTRAIAMAGGTTRGAKLDKIKLIRQDMTTLERTETIINLKEISKQNEKDFFLQPNDIIEVPGPSGAKKFLSDIFRTVVPVITRGIVPVY